MLVAETVEREKVVVPPSWNYGYLVEKNGDLYVDYGNVLQPVKNIHYTNSGIILSTDYGTYITPYGWGLKSLVKGIGRVFHYTGKFLGKVAPIAVPLLVGVGISAVAGALFGSAAATASAQTVAQAALSGNLVAAGLQAVAFAGKVVATNLISSTILRAIYKRPHGEVVIAQGNKPVLVIPQFVREVVEPHHLVHFITRNGTIRNSREIQSRVDWLANKIKQTAVQIANLYQEWGENISTDELVQHIRRIFWNIPPTMSEVEARINSYLRNLRIRLCHSYVREAYNEAVRVAPAGFASKYPISKYLSMCASHNKNNIQQALVADVQRYRRYVEEKARREEEERLRQLRLRQRQNEQERAVSFRTAEASSPRMESSLIEGIKPEYLLLGGLLLVLLLRRKNQPIYYPPYRP